MLKIRNLQQSLQMAVSDLHKAADAIITALEGNTILNEESAAGDEARVALERARVWRSLVETGVN